MCHFSMIPHVCQLDGRLDGWLVGQSSVGSLNNSLKGEKSYTSMLLSCYFNQAFGRPSLSNQGRAKEFFLPGAVTYFPFYLEFTWGGRQNLHDGPSGELRE